MSTSYGANIEESCAGCELRGEGWFCDLPPDSLGALDAIKYSTTYPKGTVLFGEGQTPHGVYVLCQGSVKLSTSSSNARVLITHIAEPGEVLGLSAAMSGKPYEVTAETLVTSRVSFIKRAQFLQLLAEHGGACARAIAQLNDNYHEAFEKARLLGLSASTSGKLARLLLQCAARHGIQTEQGVKMKVSLTHEEIGQLIGASRETITRLLSEFKSREILQTRGATMIVRNKQALESLIAT